MTSEDVIHDFFIPAFRVKQDVLPGSYTSEWFTATVPGTYHLFCAQYCGTDHASMVGEVVVLTPHDYDDWRAGVGPAPSPADAGRALMASYNCMTCHGQNAPTFAGLYQSRVRLSDGSTVIADDEYLRRSIIDANAQIVAGYPPIMPSFRGQLSAEQVNTLVEYIKQLGVTRSPATQAAADNGGAFGRPQAPPPPQGRPDVVPAPTKARQ
jgi:cytochrome c oxidase subunit 2